MSTTKTKPTTKTQLKKLEHQQKCELKRLQYKQEYDKITTRVELLQIAQQLRIERDNLKNEVEGIPRKYHTEEQRERSLDLAIRVGALDRIRCEKFDTNTNQVNE